MPLFRGGNSRPTRSFRSDRGRIGPGRRGKYGGHPAHVKTGAAPSIPFRGSRIDEAADLVAGRSDGDVNESELSEEQTILTSSGGESESSESDAGPNVSYNVLLQTLKPAAPDAAPKRKRRKLETSEVSPSLTGDVTTGYEDLEEVAGQEVSSEEDIVDEPAEEDDDPTRTFISSN